MSPSSYCMGVVTKEIILVISVPRSIEWGFRGPPHPTLFSLVVFVFSVARRPPPPMLPSTHRAVFQQMTVWACALEMDRPNHMQWGMKLFQTLMAHFIPRTLRIPAPDSFEAVKCSPPAECPHLPEARPARCPATLAMPSAQSIEPHTHALACRGKRLNCDNAVVLILVLFFAVEPQNAFLLFCRSHTRIWWREPWTHFEGPLLSHPLTPSVSPGANAHPEVRAAPRDRGA